MRVSLWIALIVVFVLAVGDTFARGRRGGGCESCGSCQGGSCASGACGQVEATAPATAPSCPCCPNGQCKAGVCQPATPPVSDFHGGPMPGPHFGPHPGPAPFIHHGGGFGGYGGYFNPLPYYGGQIIVNYETAPRMVTNPNTGLNEMMNPGRWVQAPVGSTVPFVYQSLPLWPLLGKGKGGTTIEVPVTATVVESPEAAEGRKHEPVRNIAKFFHTKKPVRKVLAHIFHRKR